MNIVKELKEQIASKETRYKEAGVLKIIEEYSRKIDCFEILNTRGNIVLGVNQAEKFRNETIPNIMNFNTRVSNAVKILEEEVDNWGSMKIKERNKLVKSLSAMQTIEDISLEIKELMEQVVKNLRTNGKVTQILAPEIIKLMEIFELNDVCIDKAHDIVGNWGQLTYIAKNNGDEERFKCILEKHMKVSKALGDINFPSIRNQISTIEEIFMNKYKDIETIRLNFII